MLSQLEHPYDDFVFFRSHKVDPQRRFKSLDYDTAGSIEWEFQDEFERRVETESRKDSRVGLGGFRVPLRAVRPARAISVSPRVEFGERAVAHTWRETISVRNSGELPVEVTWTIRSPFRILPAKAKIPVDSSAPFTVTFHPPEAGKWRATAVCCVAGVTDVWAMVSVTGAAKKPFLALSSTAVDFDQVLTGKVLSRQVVLKNLSQVCFNCSSQKRFPPLSRSEKSQPFGILVLR